MDKEDVVHIHTLKYYSARRKNKTMPFAAPLMDLEIILLSQTENDKYVSLLNLKKNDTKEFIYKTEIDSQTQKTNLWLLKGKRGEG